MMSDFEKWIHNKFNVPLEEKLEGKVISLLDYADMKEAWDARGVEESKPGPCGKHPKWAWVEDRVVIGAAGQNRMTVPGHCLICTAIAEARRKALREANQICLDYIVEGCQGEKTKGYIDEEVGELAERIRLLSAEGKK